MKWGLAITSPAERQLRKLSTADCGRIDHAFLEMIDHPFRGDIRLLRSLDGALRRRVEAWCILYELNLEHKVIVVTAIKRRGSRRS